VGFKVHFNTFFSVLAYAAGLFLLVSIASYNQEDMALLAINAKVSNLGGPFGVWIADFLRNSFGLASFLTIPFMILCGMFFSDQIDNDYFFQTAFATLLLFFTLSILTHYLATSGNPAERGGYIGHYLGRFFQELTSYRISLILSIFINGVCIYFSGIPTLLGKWSISMTKLFLGLISKKTVHPKETLPLNSIGERHVKEKKPWITKVKKNRNSYNTQRQEKTEAVKRNQDFNTTEPVITLDNGFNSALENSEIIPNPVNLSLNKTEIEVEDKRIFMKDAIFDLHSIDSEFLEAIPAEKPKKRNWFEEEISEQKKENKGIIQRTSTIPDALELDTVFRLETDKETENKEEFQTTVIEKDEELTQQIEKAAKDLDHTFHSNESCEKSNVLNNSDFPTDQTEAHQAEYLNEEKKVFHSYEVNKEYIIPSYFFNLSESADTDSVDQEIDRNSELLIKTLKDFGIQSKVVNVNRGPVITLYEIQIAAGIKVNKVSSLADDIAMALAASRVRILAPIPGKSAVGVEIPNMNRDMVSIGDILNDKSYLSSKMSLKIGLGKDILGKTVMLDLKKMPHLLIAGATGSGKSVCVNTIITSLVFNYDPDRVRFIMVDPKMVELQLYNGLPHQLTPVITEPDIAPKALKWAIYEMERRYRLLSELHTRDIDRYNQKIESFKGQSELEKLPYIVIIVDELADLMMVAPKEIENYITRIAQKARAVGIHLVLATQRPSVDVITGIIKANFPARIAFQVAQKTDSRTIIDQNGAESLLGRGDMLYQSPLSSFPVRIQGAFISEDEIIDMVRHAQKFGHPHYIDIEYEVDDRETTEAEANDAEQDELFVEALKIIEESRKASASYLQRRLSIGYNRAARMIERMEELGYVGPPQGSKPREVLV
jgi:DNA segregation ATPase FtsK/SpoIIIE-like protein